MVEEGGEVLDYTILHYATLHNTIHYYTINSHHLLHVVEEGGELRRGVSVEQLRELRLPGVAVRNQRLLSARYQDEGGNSSEGEGGDSSEGEGGDSSEGGRVPA